MNIKKLSEVLYTDQPSENAHVIVEDGGKLARTDVPSGGGVTPEIMAQIENAQWKTESSEQLFSETVTTVDADDIGLNIGTFTDSTELNSDVLIVTFDGVEYVCPKNFDGSKNTYGAIFDEFDWTYDFSTYPFQIYSYVDGTGGIVNQIVTETAGEHTVSVVGENITYNSSFADGVKKNSTLIVHFSNIAEGITSDKTVPEIIQAFNNGYLVIGVYTDSTDRRGFYYLQDVKSSSGDVSFVNCAMRFVDSAPKWTLQCIASDPNRDPNVTNQFAFTDYVLA